VISPRLLSGYGNIVGEIVWPSARNPHTHQQLIGDHLRARSQSCFAASPLQLSL
jgi:hypothetical protein